MPKTLNKNGTPRKVGSGKTKGAGCYADITWAELKKVIGENTRIQVSRVWLKNIGVAEKKTLKSTPPTEQKYWCRRKENTEKYTANREY